MGEIGNQGQAQGGVSIPVTGGQTGGASPTGGKGPTPGGAMIDGSQEHKEWVIRRMLLNDRQRDEFWHSDTSTQRDFMKKAGELSDEGVRKLANDTFGHAEGGSGPSGQGGPAASGQGATAPTGAATSALPSGAQGAATGTTGDGPRTAPAATAPPSTSAPPAPQGHSSPSAHPSPRDEDDDDDGAPVPRIKMNTHPYFDPVPEEGTPPDDETDHRVHIG
jgi:hypothetical protein